MDFIAFRDAVNAAFEALVKKGEVFVVDMDKDTLWDTYINAFPEGTNTIFRERTQHDCSCCKNFIRNIGNVVSINASGTIKTVWDIKVDDDYQVVADAMAKKVKKASIRGIFRTTEKKYGLLNNKEMMESGRIHTWEHFCANIPSKLVAKGQSVGQMTGAVDGTHGVLKRSLEEITTDAIDTVTDLISQNSLYRGEEHLPTVKKLQKMKAEYDKIKTARKKECFLWLTAAESGPAVRFRNTVIGTLLVDLSDGVDLTEAVNSFEKKVAPENYKRTSALITQSMIDNANKKVKELGIEDSLHRRFAVEDDLTINNVLFADRNSKLQADATPLDSMLKPTKTAKKNFDKVQEIDIERFINDVLPTAETLEVMVENRHTPNLVSLVAPQYKDAPKLLKWDNGFSWAYAGGITDSSIRQSVIEKGGRVDGVMRFSHSWNHEGKRNGSLMDLHVFMPNSTKNCVDGINDNYGNDQRVGWNYRSHRSSGGVQDVDYTNVAPEGYIPVENITFPDITRMPDGKYECMIHNWKLRTPTKAGFKAEIEVGGELYEYEIDRTLKHKEWMRVATVTLKNCEFSVEHHITPGNLQREVWGITTGEFASVEMMMLSPNHWDDNSVGNKHYMFMLDGCRNPGPVRGIFNEFLRSDLVEHRKVFEVLGSKMKVPYTENQLGGIGFSSTKNDAIIVKVGGSFNRMMKVVF